MKGKKQKELIDNRIRLRIEYSLLTKQAFDYDVTAYADWLEVKLAGIITEKRKKELSYQKNQK